MSLVRGAPNGSRHAEPKASPELLLPIPDGLQRL